MSATSDLIIRKEKGRGEPRSREMGGDEGKENDEGEGRGGGKEIRCGKEERGGG